ncbi:MAG: hypothetical protein JST00_07615 [Deltaproteobacteria bacterium]|nr:hypothetical protein [Deltaproteobacteria bacterium]
MSRFRRLFALAGLLSAGTFACQLLVGIGEEPFLVNDAGVPAEAGPSAPTAEASADPCDHAGPPRRIDANDRGDKKAYFLAVSSLELRTADGGPDPDGFDLDGTCTCDERPGATEAGASSCVIPSDAPSKLCDPGNRGIDNIFGIAANQLSEAARALGFDVDFGNAFTQQYANDETCGKRAMLLAITGYNGEKDDFLVGAQLLDSYGIRSAQAGGALSSIEAGCGNEDNGPPFPAKHDGTDGWSLPRDTLLDRQTNTLKSGVEAWVTDYTLVIDTRRQSLSERIKLGGLDFERSGSLLVAKLIPLDERGQRLELDATGKVANGTIPRAFAVESGVVAGRAPITPLLKSLGTATIPTPTGNSEPLCKLGLSGFIKSTLCAVRDLRSVPTRDFAGEPCDAVSFAIRFRARPALVTPDTFDGDSGVGSCPLPESTFSCE